MTKLFEEYETLRLITKNPNSLIGRKFYWSRHSLTGETLERVEINEFEILKIIVNNLYYTDASTINPYCEYQYLHYGKTRAFRPLKEILDGATEFLD